MQLLQSQPRQMAKGTQRRGKSVKFTARTVAAISASGLFNGTAGQRDFHHPSSSITSSRTPSGEGSRGEEEDERRRRGSGRE
jgi:hypothetical protein